MIQLNLLKYLDKSFSEIYQIEHGEVVEEKERKGVGKKILPLSYFLVVVLLVVALFLTYKLFFKSEKTTKAVVSNRKGEATTDKIVKKDDVKAKKYVKIAEVKIIDNVTNSSERKEKQETLKGKKLPVDRRKNGDVRKSLKKVFYLYFYSVDNDKLKRLKSFSSKYKANFKVIKRYKRIVKVWELYRYDSASKVYIAGNPVRYVKTFVSKDAAISYAKRLKTKVIVKGVKRTKNYYDVKIVTDEKYVAVFKSKKPSKILIRYEK